MVAPCAFLLVFLAARWLVASTWGQLFLCLVMVALATALSVCLNEREAL